MFRVRYRVLTVAVVAALAATAGPGPVRAALPTLAVGATTSANDVVGSVSSLKPGDATPKVFTNVDGRLPRERMAESNAAFLATKLNVATAAKTKLTLAGIREAWLDGQPLPVASEPNPSVELGAGDHLLVIKLDAKSLPDSIRAEAGEGRFLAE